MLILGYIALLFVGLVLGTLGGGGSILSVPILVYIFSLEPVTATAYSLFIVGVTSLVGSILKHRDRMVDFRTAFLFGVPSLVAIFSMRNWIVPNIPEVLLHAGNFYCTRRGIILITFAVLMIAASRAMIIQDRRFPLIDNSGNPLLMIPAGIATGLLTGLVGAGGGFIIIPILLLLTNMPFKTAVGTTLLIISVNSLSGFAGDVLNQQIDWPFLLSITGLAIAGIFLAGNLTQKLANHQLRVAFGWFVLGTGVLILVREIIFSLG